MFKILSTVFPGQPSSISDDADAVTLVDGGQDVANLINQKEIQWGVRTIFIFHNLFKFDDDDDEILYTFCAGYLSLINRPQFPVVAQKLSLFVLDLSWEFKKNGQCCLMQCASWFCDDSPHHLQPGSIKSWEISSSKFLNNGC